MSAIVEQDKVQEFSGIGSGLVARAQALTIVTDDDYTAAAEARKAMVDAKRRIEDWINPAVEKAHQAHKALTKMRADLITPIDGAVKIVDTKALAWKREQERLGEIERQRLAEEARRLAEEQRLAEAAEVEASGDPELAAAMLDEPIDVVEPIVYSSVPKVAGLSTRETWVADVIDRKLAIVAAVDRGEWGLVDLNQSALNARATAEKSSMNIPGVRARKVESFSQRRA